MAAVDFDFVIGSHNRIEITGLNNGATPPTYYNSAVVQVTVYDNAGRPVSGQTWPLTLSYIPASNGNYAGNLDYDLAIGERSGYTLQAVIEATPGLFRTVRRSGRGVWG